MATNQPIEHCSKKPSCVGFYWGSEFTDDDNHEFKQVLDSDAAGDVAAAADDDDDDDECIG